MLQEKLRVAEDLLSERGCFQLGSNLQKRMKLVAGCFLLARSLLEVNAHATREDEWRRICSLSEVASFQLESNLQKRLKLL